MEDIFFTIQTSKVGGEFFDRSRFDLLFVQPLYPFGCRPCGECVDAQKKRHVDPSSAQICVYKPWRPKGFFNLKSS